MNGIPFPFTFLKVNLFQGSGDSKEMTVASLLVIFLQHNPKSMHDRAFLVT